MLNIAAEISQIEGLTIINHRLFSWPVLWTNVKQPTNNVSAANSESIFAHKVRAREFQLIPSTIQGIKHTILWYWTLKNTKVSRFLLVSNLKL